MRRIKITLALLLCSGWVWANEPCFGYDKTIQMAGLDWDSNRFHNAVLRILLEQGYGCKTDFIPGSSLPMLAALGRGDIQIMMEIWELNIQEAWRKMEEEGRVKKLSVNFPDATQGFFVPRYMIEGDSARGISPATPDLSDVTQLPQYKDIFSDPETPSKGRFYNCILGWTCETINTKKLHAYRLLDHYTNFRPGTGAALDAAIASAYERGEPIVFYYWGPTWVLGKYDMYRLKEKPYNEVVWKKLQETEQPTDATAYPIVAVYKAASIEFYKEAPQLIEVIDRYRTSSELISSALAFIRSEKGRTVDDAARWFLQNKEDWKTWVSPEAASRIAKFLHGDGGRKKGPLLSIQEPVNQFVKWLITEHEKTFDAVATPLRSTILFIENSLLFPPWWALTLLVGALAFLIQPGVVLSATVIFSLSLLYALGLWEMSIQTLALMFIATAISVFIGVPIGILISSSERLRAAVLPVLDGMQTMPSFVYLIPALMLFGLGKVPAVFATVIYAISPLIRLTDHGIRMVDPHVVEASRSFGANYWQVLFGVQLPLALKTIMAGINQATMLGLSMVVIASMIGARGLGEQVLLGIQKLNVGQGLTAGIGIVLLAIILDRLTQAMGKRMDNTQ